MIGYFPPPYPDELLYSIIARLAARSGFRSTKALAQAVLGAETATAVADLPNRVSLLANRLPGVMNMNDDALIDRHTLWPYFAAFQSVERRAASREEMKRNGHPYLQLGLMARRCLRTEWLKFCPLCLALDRRDYREAYWHRSHQIPAIRSCHLHNTWLCNSNVPTHCARNRHQYLCADALPEYDASTVHPAGELERSLSADAAWLLANPEDVPLTGDSLYKRYTAALVASGYANFKGSVRVRKLRRDFMQYFSAHWLNTIKCMVPGERDSQESWLERLLRNPSDAHYTLHHLLLIRFLKLRLSDLALEPQTAHPFGCSPWPCLNNAAQHCGDETIFFCKVSVRNNGRGLRGVFTCPECGMIYERNGPDRAVADRMRRDHLPQYGQVWDSMLLSLWNDPTVSLRGLSRHLGVDPLTARRQAQRLGLPPIRPGHRGALPLCQALLVCRSPIGNPRTYKTAWLQLRRRLPGASITNLRKDAPAVYAFLRRHNREWLDQHRPLQRRGNPIQNRVNWFERDAYIVKQLDSAAERLLLVAPPIRLTKTAILREAGLAWACGRKSELLPATHAKLSRLAEDRISFAIRRIDATRTAVQNRGVRIPRWMLIRLAGVRPDLAATRYVREALDLAMTSMSGSTCQWGERNDRQTVWQNSNS